MVFHYQLKILNYNLLFLPLHFLVLDRHKVFLVGYFFRSLFCQLNKQTHLFLHLDLYYQGYIFFVKNEYKEKFDFALSNKKVLQEFMNKKEVKSDIFNQSTIDKLKSCGENEFPEEKEYTNKLDKIYYEYIKYIYLYQPDKIWFLNKAFCKRKVFYGDIIRFENKILNKFIIDHEIDQHEKDVRGLQKHIRESIKQQTGEDNVLEYSLKV